MTKAILLLAAGLLVAPLAWSADVSDNELRMIGEGRVLYLAHCAQCHGHDGKATVAEDGRSVPNLDGIERRDGAFGFQHVADHVSGDWARRHVTWLERQDGRYMPDWHYVLRAEFPRGDGWTRVKVLKLTKYIETLQEPATGK